MEVLHATVKWCSLLVGGTLASVCFGLFLFEMYVPQACLCVTVCPSRTRAHLPFLHSDWIVPVALPVVHLSGPLAFRVAFNLLIVMSFGAAHTILASRSMTKQLATLLPAQLVRPLYVPPLSHPCVTWCTLALTQCMFLLPVPPVGMWGSLVLTLRASPCAGSPCRSSGRTCGGWDWNSPQKWWPMLASRCWDCATSPS